MTSAQPQFASQPIGNIYPGPVPQEDIESYINYLGEQKNYLNKRRHTRSFYHKVLFAITALIFVASIILYFSEFFPNIPRFFFLIGILYSILLFLISFSIYDTTNLESEIRDIEEQMELIRCSKENHEIRAERRFRHHEYELKRYYDLTLNQSSKIFLVGLISIAAGISFIAFFSYWVTITNNDKIILGSLGAIGSILSNYVAVIYGRMYKDTINSLNQFHNRLVTTHHLHYGALLSSQIQDKKLIDQTLSQMAINTSTLERNGSKDKSSEDDPDRPELT